jgi:hypothetical protein
MRRRSAVFVTTLLVLLLAVFAIGVPRPPFVYYRNPAVIEAYLRRLTPIGSTLPEVQTFLSRHAKRPGTFVPADVQPGESYPVSSVPGSGFIHAHLGDYRVLFVSSVEAFFIFGSKQELVDIRVRKTVDAL